MTKTCRASRQPEADVGADQQPAGEGSRLPAGRLPSKHARATRRRDRRSAHRSSSPRARPRGRRRRARHLCNRSDRMLCSRSRLNISPVMTVRKRPDRPSATVAHLLCVPGWQTRQSAGTMPSATAPRICTSSPRMTSGGVGLDRPGTIAVRSARPRPGSRQSRRAGRAGHVRRFDPAAVGADHAGHQHRMIAQPLADFRDRRGKPSATESTPLPSSNSSAHLAADRSARRGGWSCPSRPR